MYKKLNEFEKELLEDYFGLKKCYEIMLSNRVFINEELDIVAKEIHKLDLILDSMNINPNDYINEDN